MKALPRSGLRSDQVRVPLSTADGPDRKPIGPTRSVAADLAERRLDLRVDLGDIMPSSDAIAVQLAARPYVLRTGRPILPTRPVNASAAKWRVSRCFKRKARSRSDRASVVCGNLPQFSFSLRRWCRLADDPSQLSGHAIETLPVTLGTICSCFLLAA